MLNYDRYYQKNFKTLNDKTLLVLYNSLIISHIKYCITTWHIGNKTTASKIQRIANKFIRLTFGLHHRANVTDILRNNNIMAICHTSFIILIVTIYLSPLIVIRSVIIRE